MKPRTRPVLSGKNRLKIAVLLHAQGPLTPTELTGLLNCSQGHVSNDLAKMRGYGLVRGRRQGVHMKYHLLAGAGQRVRAALESFEQEEEEDTKDGDDLLRSLIGNYRAAHGTGGSIHLETPGTAAGTVTQPLCPYAGTFVPFK